MLVAILTNLLAAGLLYASAKHQQLLPRTSSKRLARPLAVGLIVAAVVLIGREYDTATALLLTAGLQMAALSILPPAVAFARTQRPRS